MAKERMKHPETTYVKPSNNQEAVPEFKSKAKSGKVCEKAVTEEAYAPSGRIYHTAPVREKPISPIYSVIDNDLARDNLENDITAADLQDL